VSIVSGIETDMIRRAIQLALEDQSYAWR
jgi:hypothetical protein